MKVIFLKDVQRVGTKHDIEEVNDGYALNFLFPNKLAEMATTKSLGDLEKRQKEIRGSSLRSSSMRYPVSVS